MSPGVFRNLLSEMENSFHVQVPPPPPENKSPGVIFGIIKFKTITLNLSNKNRL